MKRLIVCCLMIFIAFSAVSCVLAEGSGVIEEYLPDYADNADINIRIEEKKVRSGFVTPKVEIITIDEPEDGLISKGADDMPMIPAKDETRFTNMLGWQILANYEHCDDMRAVYIAMYDGIINSAGEEIQIFNNDVMITTDEAMVVADAMFYDHSELATFQLSGGFSLAVTGDGNAMYYLPALTTYDYESARATIQSIDDRMDPILRKIVSRSKNQYEIVLGIHDWLCMNIEYVDTDNAHNMIGALKNGRAVCDGYSHAFQYLLRKCGIESFVVTGYAGEGHAWNLVKIDGKWSCFDVTWDDGGDTKESIFYAYFAITDKMIEEDHTLDSPESNKQKDYYRYLPAANTLEHSYHRIHNSFVSLDTIDVESIAGMFINDYARLYVTDQDTAAFKTWYSENLSAIIREAGMWGSLSSSISRIGHEYHLKITGNKAGIGWEISPDGVLTIHGSGAMPDYEIDNQPWGSERSNITKIVIDEGFTTIGANAFVGCANLTAVDIPSTVQKINDHAFEDCKSLGSIRLTDKMTVGDYVFSGCGISDYYIDSIEQWLGYDHTTLADIGDAYRLYIGEEPVTELEIPDGTATIGAYAFYNCELDSIVIPCSVMTIEEGALVGGYTVYYEGSETQWNAIQKADDSCGSELICMVEETPEPIEPVETVTPGPTISPDTCAHDWEEIAEKPATCVAEGCTAYKVCKICGTRETEPEAIPATHVHYLAENKACRDCEQRFDLSGMYVVEIPTAVKKINSNAFESSAIEAAIVPAACKSIGSRAFANCALLKYVFIPNGIEYIAEDAFEGSNPEIIYQ